MQAQLYLGLCPVVSDLAHQAKLHFQVLFNGIAEGPIGPVSVEELDRPSITNVALAVDEQFVVKGKIERLFVNHLTVQGDIDKQIISITSSEILVFYPTLFITKTVPQIEDASNFLRKQGFLVNPTFSIRNLGRIIFSRCDVCITQRKENSGILWSIGQPSSKKKLLKIPDEVPVSILEIPLEDPTALP